MYHMKRERVKTYIILVLILTSIIQVGILWSYQNHGLPINFLIGIFSKTGSVFLREEMISDEELFVPYRVSLSDGNESHWIISKNDDKFTTLWDDAKAYLKDTLKLGKPQQILSAEEWGEIVTKRGLIYEFKFNLSSNLLRWFMDMAGSSQSDTQGIHKMMLLPRKDITENYITLYILDSAGISKYVLPVVEGRLDFHKYKDLFTKYEQSKGKDDTELAITKDMGLSGNYPINPDILGVVRGSKFRRYNSINFTIPNKLSDQEEMAKDLLGSEKDSYDSYTDYHGTVVFKNLNNIYRMYADGFLEYEYIPGTGTSEKGDMTKAFANSLTFLSRVDRLLTTQADIYLSGIVETQNSYRFSFDYKIQDYPIQMNYTGKGKYNEAVTNAIVIEANSQRIIRGYGILKNIEFSREAAYYNVNMGDLMNSFELDLSEQYINDMTVAYVIKTKEEKNLKPVWLIEIKDAESITVPLSEKGE
jgi:hypothetical protein